MSQSKKASLVESVINTGVGFIFSTALWYWVVGPYLDRGSSITESVGVTLFFTVSSIFRNYVIRRLFIWWSIR